VKGALPFGLERLLRTHQSCRSNGMSSVARIMVPSVQML
jgi:hypothetical protein